jgi:hypothetical protein
MKKVGAKMRDVVFSIITAVGMLAVTSLPTSAVPLADPLAISNMGQQVDVVLMVITKKHMRKIMTTTDTVARCPTDPSRSNYTGPCRASGSQ